MNQQTNSLTLYSPEKLSHYYAACQISLFSLKKDLKNPLISGIAKERVLWSQHVMSVNVKRITDAIDQKPLAEFGIDLKAFRIPILLRDH